jgi:hypothetical protein
VTLQTFAFYQNLLIKGVIATLVKSKVPLIRHRELFDRQ